MSAYWWPISQIRKAFIKRHLTLPPLAILRECFEDAAKECPAVVDDATLLIAIGGRNAMERSAEFADPAILLADLKAWHTPARGRELKELHYRDFLKTWYWLALSSYKVVVAGGCECCGTSLDDLDEIYGHLECHHAHYRLRGFEIRDLTCLEVLCNSCHAAMHDKETRGIGSCAQGFAAVFLGLDKRWRREGRKNA